jgi:hypothetical protein
MLTKSPGRILIDLYAVITEDEGAPGEGFSMLTAGPAYWLIAGIWHNPINPNPKMTANL